MQEYAQGSIRIISTSTVVFLVVVILLSGCTHVESWERGHLAKPHMALNPYPIQSSLRAHNYSSREAASVGSAAEGGGCGCY